MSRVCVSNGPPAFLTGYLGTFRELTRCAGLKVGSAQLLSCHRLAIAHPVGIYHNEPIHSAVVGIAALKTPRPTYATRIAQSAGITELGNVELGYLWVMPTYRRHKVAKQLVRALDPPLGTWATTSVDNQAAIRLLQSSGFIPIGNPYPSRNSRTQLRVYIKS